MTTTSGGVWEVLSTARTIRRFTYKPVDDATLAVIEPVSVMSDGRAPSQT